MFLLNILIGIAIYLILAVLVCMFMKGATMNEPDDFEAQSKYLKEYNENKKRKKEEKEKKKQ